MNRKAFTLMELIIVVSIFTALFVGVIAALNPLAIMNRANDAKRKKDLDDAKKMLEQYATDTGCYPQPTLVCMEGTNTSPCHICTTKQTNKFKYFTKDICDPKNKVSNYLYQLETTLNPGFGYVPPTCPKWFRIYSALDSTYNPNDDIWNCKRGGCGVSPSYGYSYLVTSPGAPTDDYASQNWFCYASRFGRCLQCSPYDNCISPSNECYEHDLYPTRGSCCSANGVVPCS